MASLFRVVKHSLRDSLLLQTRYSARSSATILIEVFNPIRSSVSSGFLCDSLW